MCIQWDIEWIYSGIYHVNVHGIVMFVFIIIGFFFQGYHGSVQVTIPRSCCYIHAELLGMFIGYI